MTSRSGEAGKVAELQAQMIPMDFNGNGKMDLEVLLDLSLPM